MPVEDRAALAARRAQLACQRGRAVNCSQLPNQLASFVPDLRDSDDEFRLRLLLHGFGLVWQDATHDQRSALVAVEPERFDPRWDAFLAALAEHLCEESGLDAPPWTQDAGRWLSEHWHAGGCFAHDHGRSVAQTPRAFDGHGIWLPADELVVV